MNFVHVFADRAGDGRTPASGPRAVLCHAGAGLTVLGPGAGDASKRYALRLKLDAASSVLFEGGVPAEGDAAVTLSDERLVLLSREDLARLHKRAGEILQAPSDAAPSRPALIEPSAMPTPYELMASLAPPPPGRTKAATATAASVAPAVLPAWQRLRTLPRLSAVVPFVVLLLTVATATLGLRIVDGGAKTDAKTGGTSAVTAAQAARAGHASGEGSTGGLAAAGPASAAPDATPTAAPPPPAHGLASAAAASPVVPSAPAASPLPSPSDGKLAFPIALPKATPGASPQAAASMLASASADTLASPVALPQAAPVAPPQAVSVAHLAIHATANAWVTLRDRQGRVLGQRLMAAGQTWTPPAETGLLLTTGNAGGTRIVIDGVRGVTLGRPGMVLHDVALDKLAN